MMTKSSFVLAAPRAVFVLVLLLTAACSNGTEGSVEVPVPIPDAVDADDTNTDGTPDDGVTGNDFGTPGPGIDLPCTCETAADCEGELGICLEWTCDQCRCEEAASTDGTVCDDGKVCTEADQCIEGNCTSVEADCDDGDPCTDDACDSVFGCVNDPNDAPCDDGNACTDGDVCFNGVCSPGASTCAEDCSNGEDDDGDSDIDCQDTECAAEAHCLNECVVAPDALACGTAIQLNLSGVGGAKNTDEWACTPEDFPGHEWAFDFVTDSAVAVTASFDQRIAGMQLMRIQGDACSPAACLDSGTTALTFDALPGSAHKVIVETAEQLTGTVTLNIACAACEPKCAAKQCGPDGCGGSCGTCANGFECVTGGQCLAQADNDKCSGATVIEADELPVIIEDTTETGNDDYLLTAPASCDGAGAQTVGLSAPDLAYKFTPQLTGEYLIALEADFDGALYIVTDCAAVDSSCVMAAQTLGTGDEQIIMTLSSGVGYFIIVDGFSVSADGPFRLTINNWPCAAACTGKACGADTCGGSCGSCGIGNVCTGGVCLEPTVNDTCGTALPITSVPYDATHKTTGAQDDYLIPPEVCPGGPGTTAGSGAGDLVYVFTAPGDGKYAISVTPTGAFDALLSIWSDCPLPQGPACLGGSDTAGVETVDVTLSAGETVHIVVDGAGEAESGTFAINIVQSQCIPACTGKVCGDNGCGGECGACGLGQVCAATGQCADLPPNDTCADALVISGLPYTFSGNTTGATDDYQAPKAVCLDGPAAASEGAGNDVAFVYTSSANHKVRFGFEAIGTTFNTYLYATSNCSNIGSSCQVAPNSANPGAEVLVMDMTIGQTVFILVDGWSKASSGFYTFTANVL